MHNHIECTRRWNDNIFERLQKKLEGGLGISTPSQGGGEEMLALASLSHGLVTSGGMAAFPASAGKSSSVITLSVSPCGTVESPAPQGFVWGDTFSFDDAGQVILQHTAEDSSAHAHESSSRASPVHVVVSVDWEGWGLEAKELDAYRQLRDDYPHVSLTHYLNAAYYTRLAPDDVIGAVKTSDTIRTVLRAGDEIGLHLHADDHLMRAAGVTPQHIPSWSHMVPGRYSVPDNTGHTVPLSMFSEAEVRQVVAFACRTLEQQGFDRPRVFRAGGWHADSDVLRAVAAEGFIADGSEVPSDWFGERNFGFLAELWPHATRLSQPYRLQSGLVEVPDNCCLSDYATAEEMVEGFEALARLDRGVPLVLSLGFHQESASEFLPRLRSALTEIDARAAREGIPLSYDTTSGVAHLAGNERFDGKEDDPAEGPSALSEQLSEECVLGDEGACLLLDVADKIVPSGPDAKVPTLAEAAAKAKWLSSVNSGRIVSTGRGRVRSAAPMDSETAAKDRWLQGLSSPRRGGGTVISTVPKEGGGERGEAAAKARWLSSR
jgi:hypothetical protein